jgi:hypothetical protein
MKPWDTYDELINDCRKHGTTSCAVCGLEYEGAVLLCPKHMLMLEEDGKVEPWKRANADRQQFTEWCNFRSGFQYDQEVGPSVLTFQCANCNHRAINDYLCWECRNV